MRFGSITLNERECCFLQPKLELYGLYRALRSLKLYLIGVRNLVIEVDARYIKGMLRNLDISPSASMNRWILAILMFHFDLVHVPGTNHTPDGLSRQKPQPGDEEEIEDDFEDWIDEVNGFIHYLNPHLTSIQSLISTPPIASYIYTDMDNSTNTSVSGQQEEDQAIPYSIIPRSDVAMDSDHRLEKVKTWLETLERPIGLSDAEYKTLM